MKYLQAYAEVDLSAIRHNLEEMKKHIGKQVKLLAVIKADAYGHGAVPVAKHIEDLADYYAVAHLSEATELRRYGITKPILILGYCAQEEFAALLQDDITINIFRREEAEELSRVAVSMGKTAKVHIKIDTGMSRIGFLCEDSAVSEILAITKLPNLEVEGAFTHFAKADEADKTAFYEQLDRFRKMIAKIEEGGYHFPIVHAANSAAIMEQGDLGFDMVRSGISTYGLYPSEEVDVTRADLQPAMQLKAHITHIKSLPCGVGIGYGWTFVTKRDTVVATVPIGYADGYKRALSNQAEVLVKGRRVPILGRICMDQCMIDVTDLEDVKVGDVVTLFGRDGEACIPVEEVALPAASFNYEFICGMTRRIPRVYYKDGQCVGILDYLQEVPYCEI